MQRSAGLALALSAALVAPAFCARADDPVQHPGSVQAIVDHAPAADWRAIEPDRSLYLQVNGHTVVIELAPEFAPKAVANILKLVRSGYFDTAAIVRAQDNYVVQWADPLAEDPHPIKGRVPRSLGDAAATVPMEVSRTTTGLSVLALPDPDPYATRVGLADGFPVAGTADRIGLAHCYGMVGVGRDTAPDSGNGSELYAVIGQSPRALDGNVTLVGRVVWGMQFLSILPRGTGPLGFYTDRAQNVAVGPVRLGTQVPSENRLKLEALRTDSVSYHEILDFERGPRNSWFVRAPLHIGLCEMPLPVRKR